MPGTSFRLEGSNSPAPSTGVLSFGLPITVPVPILGLPLWLDPTAPILTGLLPVSTADWSLSVAASASPSLVGVHLGAQAVHLDSMANLSTTNGVELWVGN